MSRLPPVLKELLREKSPLSLKDSWGTTKNTRTRKKITRCAENRHIFSVACCVSTKQELFTHVRVLSTKQHVYAFLAIEKNWIVHWQVQLAGENNLYNKPYQLSLLETLRSIKEVDT